MNLILTSSSTMDWRHIDMRMAWLDTMVTHSSFSGVTRYSKLSSSCDISALIIPTCGDP